jgi:hypothetical protein
MNVLKPMPEPGADDLDVVPIGRHTALPPAIAPGAGRKTFRMFLAAALLVGGGVAFGLGGIPSPRRRSMRPRSSAAA